MILAAASLAALVVAFPLGVLADRLGARRVTIASAVLFTLATLGQGLADGVLDAPARTSGVRRRLRGAMGSRNARGSRTRSPHERRTGALGAATTVAGIGFTLGPVLAGVLADRYDTGTPFLVARGRRSRRDGRARGRRALRCAEPSADSTCASFSALARRRRRSCSRASRSSSSSGSSGGGVNLLVPLQLQRERRLGRRDRAALLGRLGVYTVVSAIVARLGDRAATLRVGGVAALLTGLSIVLVLVERLDARRQSRSCCCGRLPGRRWTRSSTRSRPPEHTGPRSGVAP